MYRHIKINVIEHHSILWNDLITIQKFGFLWVLKFTDFAKFGLFQMFVIFAQKRMKYFMRMLFKGLFPDFSIIFLCYQLVDIHVRILNQQFQPIPILR